MGELIRLRDWSATPLGPRHSWPPVLRASINIILSSAFPMVVLWGRELLLIYNDAYRVIAAGKHPAALGQSTRDCWPEVWHINKPILEGVMRRGEVTYLENQLFPVTRHGYLEESYFTLSYSPIWTEDGTVGGAFVTLLETTSAVLSDRRMRTLRDLASQTSDVSEVDSACQAVVRVLEGNLADVPFGLLYLMDDDGTELRLAGLLGIEQNSPAAIDRLLLREPEQGQQWPVSETLSRGLLEMNDLRDRFGLLPGGWAGPARSALAFALRPTSESPDVGLVVLGISNGRALDEEYRAFLKLTASQIGSALGQAHTRTEERIRARAELVASEAKYRQIVETTHEGIWITDPDSVTTYVNPQMAAMLGYQLGELRERNISNFLSARDLPAFREEERELKRAAAGGRQAEYRLQRKDESVLCAEVNTTVLLDDQGRLTGVLRTFSDITERKRAEEALRDAEARLRLAAETTDFGAFDFYPLSGELIWSAQAKRHFGLPPDAQVDYHVFLRGLHPEDRVRVNQLVRDVMLPGSSGEYMTEYRTIGLEDGKERWIEARGRVLFDHEGKPMRFIGATVDITRRKQAEEEIDRQRELLQSIIDNIPVMIAIYDPRLETFRFNRELRKVLGWTENDVIQGDFMSKVYPDPDYREMVTAFMQSLEPGWRDLEVTAKDGSKIVSSWANIRLSDQTSVGIGIDIRRRKRDEEALRESEERFRILADNSPVILWMTNPEGGLHFVNRTYREFFGASLEDVKGGRWQPLVHPDDAPHYVAAFQKAVRERAPFRSEARVKRHDGAWRWVTSYGDPRSTTSGQFLGHVGISPDITERKQAEEELRGLNRSLEQRVAERTAEAERRAEELRALAAELARTEEREQRRLAEWLHDELQQVLVAAKMQIQLTHSAVKEPGLRELLEKACHLVDESIGQSRSLTADLTPPILYHSGLVSGLEQLAHWFAEKHHLRVTVEPRSDLKPENQEAAVVLFNAARELLFNVVKHAGVDQARVILSETDGRVQLSVEDQGAGFDSARLAESSRAGFGLLNLRERLHFIGGEMQIQSAPGRGTRITLLAPKGPERSLPGGAQAEVESSKTSSVVGQPSAENTEASSAIRVLLVDDHRMVREGLAGLLEQDESVLIVGQANDGHEAVELTRELKPDVVMMDISMPRMNGIRATQRIKNEFPHVRIIGLSMHGEREHGAAMRQAGADAFLHKGGAGEELLAAIRKVAGHQDDAGETFSGTT